MATMLRSLHRLLALLGLMLLLPAAWGQQRILPSFWDLDKAVESEQDYIQFRKPDTGRILMVSASRVQMLVSVRSAIEKTADIKAKLYLTDSGLPYPNAMSGRGGGGAYVAVNAAMVELLGEDADAVAALLGHEYAHLALKHRDQREQRGALEETAGSLLGALLGMAGVPLADAMTSVGGTVMSRAFNRDEEREADEQGMRYAVSAGYAASGGVRLWSLMNQRLADAPKGSSFLATHPAGAERLETMRALAERLQPAATAPDATAK
ncbi:MAG TPA: M48 family metallopeptidase [Rhodocyclaceae bacterium]